MFLENKREDDIIITERLFEEEQTQIKRKTKKFITLKKRKQLDRANINLDDKALNKKLVKNFFSFYFTIGNIKKRLQN